MGNATNLISVVVRDAREMGDLSHQASQTGKWNPSNACNNLPLGVDPRSDLCCYGGDGTFCPKQSATAQGEKSEKLIGRIAKVVFSLFVQMDAKMHRLITDG